MRSDPVMLRIMLDTFTSIPEEMGRALKRTAYSPNIKERMDASCALFDRNGELLSQAEHIPVHLGSMPLVVKKVLETLPDLDAGDMIMVNDPAHGGTHLPDITLILPVFHEENRVAFVVNRAHHADIGGMTPGSMPAGSTELFQEGLIIPPVRIVSKGEENRDLLNLITSNTRTPGERLGDLRAQFSACGLGERRYIDMLDRYGPEMVLFYENEVKAYSRRLTRERLTNIPDGHYHALERIELDRSDGTGTILRDEAMIEVDIEVRKGEIIVDFKGTDPELEGNLNAPLAVTLSAVYYVFRCLTGSDIPNNAGCYRDIHARIPVGCLLNPAGNRAVCSGNVETSQRIVEALFSALGDALSEQIPAGSQGTMNNLIIGGRGFSYYETLGGGEGAHPWRDGENGIHSHMTNTRNTPVEAVEIAYPLRVHEYSLIDGTGGMGRYRGGDGIRRRIEFHGEMGRLSILSGNRRFSPAGRLGGEDGKSGRNLLVRDGKEILLSSLADAELLKQDQVVIETPGGGGWGLREKIGTD